mmetsp:Transcript_77008/g.214126  ORF Transcript_77008/g.214126 Transcript_77008/m.214126 type:complete len:222 (-) Transcript_77008:125-790(-)|eukprot:CAMPEP_0117498064 /NCGR_PEP_ID=MMETSP0784-20121206/21517_1 /TAXON_ID=39447 /ORGANISM="" /LENGTH=221 /DNA_ID=CAMNT_0005293129 /DNA_START=84 /DNA_END=749 /DNA_ORIENTATION=+
MAKLADALKEAAEFATQEEDAFNSNVSPVLSRIKRGVAEVRDSPDLLAEVPPDPQAWGFLLRASGEKAAYMKQVWDVASLLLGSPAWAEAFAGLEDKHRLNVAKAASRESEEVARVAVQFFTAGVAELPDLVPLEVVETCKPAFCAALLEALEASGNTAALECEVGLALRIRAESSGTEEKRKVIGGTGEKKAFGKSEGLPVFVCEGISGSHQKMEIKKGL